MSWDTQFPPLLAALHQLEFDYDQGIDFEAYDAFWPAAENAEWVHAWTGNQELDAAEYRIFGMDGTGGQAGFWLAREGVELLDQPVVFFGSEGEVGMVANDFADYLWLLAGGVGPYEAVEYGGEDASANTAFTAFAQQHAAAAKKTPVEVIARANEAYPTFRDDFMALCKYG